MSFPGTDFRLLVGSPLLLLVWAKQGPWVSEERGLWSESLHKRLRALPAWRLAWWTDRGVGASSDLPVTWGGPVGNVPHVSTPVIPGTRHRVLTSPESGSWNCTDLAVSLGTRGSHQTVHFGRCARGSWAICTWTQGRQSLPPPSALWWLTWHVCNVHRCISTPGLHKWLLPQWTRSKACTFSAVLPAL